jgi:site-specific recombinase XerD
MHENGLQKAVKLAAQQAGLTKKVHCHCLRHYSACRIMPNGRLAVPPKRAIAGICLTG